MPGPDEAASPTRPALATARGAAVGGPGGAVVRVPARTLDSAAFLGRPLARAMRAAGLGLGALQGTRCLDAAS
jgi:hypothetical protein